MSANPSGNMREAPGSARRDGLGRRAGAVDSGRRRGSAGRAATPARHALALDRRPLRGARWAEQGAGQCDRQVLPRRGRPGRRAVLDDRAAAGQRVGRLSAPERLDRWAAARPAPLRRRRRRGAARPRRSRRRPLPGRSAAGRRSGAGGCRLPGLCRRARPPPRRHHRARRGVCGAASRPRRAAGRRRYAHAELAGRGCPQLLGRLRRCSGWSRPRRARPRSRRWRRPWRARRLARLRRRRRLPEQPPAGRRRSALLRLRVRRLPSRAARRLLPARPLPDLHPRQPRAGRAAAARRGGLSRRVDPWLAGGGRRRGLRAGARPRLRLLAGRHARLGARRHPDEPTVNGASPRADSATSCAWRPSPPPASSFGHLPALGELATTLLGQLRERWGPEDEMPLYPAFRAEAER